VPANLTPEYFGAEEKFKKASATPEKITALQEMLRAIPKHKGTEKMQADIKRRLARLRKESQKKKSPASQKPSYYVEREGAGQVVLCGPPNGGKSQFLDRLTHAAPEVADYPYTTRRPLAGMMSYQDIMIQLVDTPPLAPEILESWQLAMIEQTDAALLVFDVNDANLLEQTEFIVKTFEDRGISISGQRPKFIVLGNKIDAPHGTSNLAAWQELYQAQFQAEPISALSDACLAQLRQRLFDVLEIVRIYTKAPGKKPADNPTPYVLKRGSTIVDVARTVHKDIAQSFKFARVWGKTRFEGQMVERSYIVEDGDLVELHG
jgi:ribosome-interacting GTPase 1